MIKSTRKLPISILSLFFFAAACTPPDKHQADVLTFAQRVDSVIAATENFSGVVLIADHGKVIYQSAKGYADRVAHKPIDSATVFELASVSKQFTAMLVAMLAEEGKLKYDDSLSNYIPGLPYRGITIRHLLNHTSGLPDYQKLMDEKWDKAKVANNDDIIAYLKKFHPAAEFKPGTKYNYSNTGYVLLGTVVEKASGVDFVALAHQRIFDPLNMTQTDLRSWAQKLQLNNFAFGYMTENNKLVRADSVPSSNYTVWLGGRKGPGRISSNALDLVKWDQALSDSVLVKPSTLKEIFSPAHLTDGSISNYGFGWMLKSDSTLGNVVYHTGDNPGYKTEIFRCLDCHKTVIVLCNNSTVSFEKLMKGIIRQL